MACRPTNSFSNSGLKKPVACSPVPSSPYPTWPISWDLIIVSPSAGFFINGWGFIQASTGAAQNSNFGYPVNPQGAGPLYPNTVSIMSKSFFRRTAVLLIVWIVLLGILSANGFFSSFSKFPPRLGFALLLPLPLVMIFSRSQAGKQLLQQIKPQWLIYLQSFRILVEIALWLLVRNGSLPVQMSFEGRNFDILSGLLALPVGYYCFVRKSWPPVAAVIYNIVGLVLLVNIVVIANLSMPTPLRMFHNSPDSSLITTFPFIYLPGLLVPLAYTLHILSLRQIGLFKRGAVRKSVVVS